jgi:hypothetical protein
MGTVHPLPGLSRRQTARVLRVMDIRQDLRLRIDRRARELAERDQARYFRAILFEVYSGKLDPEIIQFWEPLAGGVGVPERKGA